MGYYGDHYFLNIKMSVFATGSPHVSYVIKHEHLLHKIRAVSGKVHRLSILCTRWGTLTPPY